MLHAVAVFVVGRFLLGFGIPFAIVAASSLIGELAYPKERARIGSLFNASWYIGATVAAGVTLGTFQMPNNWAWRIPSFFQVVPSLLQITFIWFLPESPRWLVYQDRNDEALKVIARVHGTSSDDAQVQVQYREIMDTLNYEKSQGRTLGYQETIKSKTNRRRLLLAVSVAPLAMLTGSNTIT